MLLLALAVAACQHAHVVGLTAPGDKAALLAFKAGVTKVNPSLCALVP